MYDLAFKMRSDRHELERVHAEAMQQIETKKVEVKQAQKLMQHHTDVYLQENNTLLEFRVDINEEKYLKGNILLMGVLFLFFFLQRKRQQELNKVYVTVILQMHQIQHFREGEDYRDLSKALLFDSTIIMDLQDRVDQLNLETIETKRFHRINIVHLRRMNTDLKFMRSKITSLEAQIKEEMIKKFGMIIKLEELEEEVLRKYVFELETSAEHELRLLEKEIAKKKVHSLFVISITMMRTDL